MLHFQGRQHNAILRATDVKPRFDRWLIENVFRGDYEQCKEFLVGYDGKKDNKDLEKKFNTGFRALNYKMRIVQECGSKVDSSHELNERGKKVSKLPAYFGNEINTVYANGKLQVTFVFTSMPDDKLYRVIESKFGEFIGSHNFGTRSSKGYGSFTVEGAQMPPYISISMKKVKTWEDVLIQLDLFYKTIRSGINATREIVDKSGNKTKEGYYFKSMIFSYVQDKYTGKQWDKKVIKNHFLKENQQYIPDDNKIDVRDFLGLSTAEMWMKYNMTITKEIENISRFSSPIVFKPVNDKIEGWKIYIVIHEIPDRLKGREIVVKGKIAKKDKPAKEVISKIESYDLKGMRMAQDFSVEEYLNYLFVEKPEKVKESDWMEAVDIKNRFKICKQCNKNKEAQIDQIVYIYREFRKAYKNKK